MDEYQDHLGVEDLTAFAARMDDLGYGLAVEVGGRLLPVVALRRDRVTVDDGVGVGVIVLVPSEPPQPPRRPRSRRVQGASSD